jgi:hypothetical protein
MGFAILKLAAIRNRPRSHSKIFMIFSQLEINMALIITRLKKYFTECLDSNLFDGALLCEYPVSGFIVVAVHLCGPCLQR